MRLPLALLCLVCTFCCCGAQVSQSPEALMTREGDRSTMTCTYSNTYRPFQWYRQVPSGEITHLLTVAANRNVTEGRVRGEWLESGQKSRLHIAGTRLDDSGRYFCAVEAQ
ncbi:hypothetical protein Y1Q_0010589 [Alligator mississippiensis]|uniref:Ig-like domain-containing protein n=1 Tax=Alligator mississippiensis TaxID=8496 RepID=A0A151PGQ2_ALLMI|nr:hypothetical protein Y1Q_0010589 [Alligator mississippiensis]